MLKTSGSRIALGGFGLSACLAIGLSACASRPVVLEVSGTVMYAKPEITEVSHELTDSRDRGGTVVLRVVMLGDPGLQATFDISPDIVEQEPMQEIAEGRYEAEFSFAREFIGGPLTIVGRLVHEQAGEVTQRDPNRLTIPMASDP